jgi:hypothetical protein
MLAPATALAGPDLDGSKDAPEQMLGIQFRLGASGLAGEGAGDVDQPPLSHASGSLQVRVIESWYVDLSSFGERTLKAEAPEGKTILGLEGTTLGVRYRPPLGANPRNRMIAGVGAGGGRVFVQQVESFGGSMGYAAFGFEKEIYGDDFNAGYVGVEGIYTHFFVGEDSPFRGGSATVRLTFSYYMGGSYLADCW